MVTSSAAGNEEFKFCSNFEYAAYKLPTGLLLVLFGLLEGVLDWRLVTIWGDFGFFGLLEILFLEVIKDYNTDPQSVQKVLLCCGKVYYDLLAHQQKNQIKDIAIIRLEQLYPFPKNNFLLF